MAATQGDMRTRLIKDLQATNLKLTELFAREVDIHTHTREIGQYFLRFYSADHTYQLSSTNHTLDSVIQEILQKCPSIRKPNVSKVLNSIKNSVVADDETHINLQELLIRVWSLTKSPYIFSNCIDIIMHNLDHNIITGGGCIPGIAARLVQPYTAFILHLLKQLNQQQHNPDDDLNKAIAASLIQVQQPPHKQYPDSDFKKATALSLLNSKQPRRSQDDEQNEDEEFLLALYESKLQLEKEKNKSSSNKETEDLELALALSKSTIEQ